MTRRFSPKYPNKSNRLRKRLLIWGLPFLFVVCGGAFYGYLHGPGGNSTADAPNSQQTRLAQPVRPAQAPVPPVNPEKSAPTRFMETPAPSPAPLAPAKAPDTAARSTGAEETVPFAGQSLDEIAARLSRVYGEPRPAQWGERLPGITTRLQGADNAHGTSAPLVLALTLDACSGGAESYDAGLIAFLREKHIPATLFVSSLWLKKHPEELRALAADPLFEIAAHGTRHRPCSVNGRSAYSIQGTASMNELVEEVEGNARDIAGLTGKRPRWFRSGTAHYDEIAVRVIRDLGLGIAGYSIAGDQGATLPAAAVSSRTLGARPGDILLLHMNKPKSGTRRGLEKALPKLLERGAVFVRLSDANLP